MQWGHLLHLAVSYSVFASFYRHLRSLWMPHTHISRSRYGGCYYGYHNRKGLGRVRQDSQKPAKFRARLFGNILE